VIKYLVKFPILKRLIPSLGIRIFKFLKINRGFYKINKVYFYLDFLDPVDRQIIINKKYEDDAIKFLLAEFNKNSFSIFLDIGSNSGYFSFYFASKFKNLKIIAFEPNLDAFEKFNKTVGKNNFQNIKIFNQGLSDTNKTIKMITWFKHGYAKTNSIIFEDHHDKKDSKVFSAILKVGDEIINYQNEYICIKIDVEGHEISVLKGLINNLSQNKCLILIEIADDKFKFVNDFLVGNNYKMIFKSHFRLDYIYSNL